MVTTDSFYAALTPSSFYMQLMLMTSAVEEDHVPQASAQSNSGLVYGVCSQQGKRPYQEDEYSV